jgi:hypothetical protein
MTSTGPADAVMSACGHAKSSRPVLARPGSRELLCVRPASGEPAFARAVFPREAAVKPASGHLRPAGPLRRTQRAGTPYPPCPRPLALARPLYLYLLKWRATAPSGSSFDPGRVMLCIHTSPPRWLQWP